jgi:MFS family permease
MSPRTFRFFAFSGHGINDLYWFVLPIVLPAILVHYQLRFAGGGTLLSIYLFVVALGSIVFGRVSDKVDRWRLIGAGFLLGSAGFALAPLGGSLVVLVSVLSAAAIGVSIFHPAMYGAIEASVANGRGRFYGAFESWGAAAIFAMMIATGLLLRRVEWGPILVVIAVPGAVAGIAFLSVRTRPVVHARPDAAADPVPRKLLVAFLVVNMLRFVTVTGVLSFVPTLLVFVVGMEPDAAGLFAAFFAAGSIAGSRIGGVLGDSSPPLRMMVISAALIAPVVALLGTVTSAWAIALVLVAIGFVTSVCVTLQNITLREFNSRLGGGTAFGLLWGLMATTQALSPAAFGLVADATGLPAATRWFALPAVASWLLLWRIARAPSLAHLVSTRRPAVEPRGAALAVEVNLEAAE